MGENATDPFDSLQPIPAKPKPEFEIPITTSSTLSPSASANGVTPMGPGASQTNAQRDAHLRDAIANKMDEMLGKGLVHPKLSRPYPFECPGTTDSQI